MKSSVRKRKMLDFLKVYGFIPAGAAAGLFAGIWGFAAGLLSGVFMSIISCRIYEEFAWRKAIGQGSAGSVSGEPFPGALFMCAITFYCLNDKNAAYQLTCSFMGKENRASWAAMCRTAASVKPLNRDLLVECLAHKLQYVSSDLMRRIFLLLGAAEFSWNENEKNGMRPSRYLAELLDYKYINSELSEAYRVLGLEPGVPVAEVKAAHRKLAVQYHPDNIASGSLDSADFIKIQSAYEFILHQFS